MDNTKAITHISLCSGYGGIDLGLKRVVPNMRTVAYSEIEAFAIANLVAKMEAGFLDPAPVWPNLKTFPWEAFRDRVDILTGGYPCQPFSAAGQRRGKDDPRHLWPYIADGIRLLQPKLCFFENVEGHISLGLSDVIEDLAGMGYRTTWGIFSASECGAPHQRKRVFVLAHCANLGGEIRHLVGSCGQGKTGDALPCGKTMADSTSDRFNESLFDRKAANQTEGYTTEGICAWPSRPGEQQYGWEPPRVVLAHSSDNGCASGEAGGDVCGEQSDTRRQEESASVEQSAGSDSFASLSGEAMADSHRVDRSAPAEGRQHDRQAGSAGEAVADTGSIARGTSGRQLQSEQLEEGGRHSEATESGSGNNHGPAGEELVQRQTQPPLGGDVDGLAGGLDYAELCVTCDNRTDELRLLGNGVVPATAAIAFRTLLAELFTQ